MDATHLAGGGGGGGFFPRVRGFLENIQQLIFRLRFFFLKWRLARAY